MRKIVSQYNGSSWTIASDKRFVYDGWNLIEEQTLSPASSQFYVWGLDLSQSLQGAGGIGGLLATVSGSTTDYFLYDGNGNVGQLINAVGGSLDAQYEYDPYGNLILSTGTLSASNPFRFSTKYLDTETGLYYYGYRYYDPKDGRWLTRDPIEEDGGLNLYSFTTNQPTNFTDTDGRFLFPLIIYPRISQPHSNIDNKIFGKGVLTFNLKDHVDDLRTGFITVGVELYKTGEIRLNYAELAAQLKEAGLSEENARKARDSLKEEFRKKQTQLGKALTKNILEQRQKSGMTSALKTPHKTNVEINVQAKIFKNTGRALVILNLFVEGVNIYNTPEGERLEETARAGGSLAGGFAVASYGAEICAPTGPWGVITCTFIGGVAGSIVGEGIIDLFCDKKGQNE